MNKNFLKIIVAGLFGLTALAGGMSTGASAEGELTFAVGITQDIDSLNVTVGFLVIDYEIWNLTLPMLTSKAASDFSILPSMAESWTSSEDGLTWTYKLRSDMKWSDGVPMTADDVAYTITRSVQDGWWNHTTVTGNLTATATDAQTLVVTSSVPDPKLPILDVYIVPKHIYEKISAEDLPNYLADDYVSGGPFQIVERKEGEFVRLVQNPNWFGKKPAMDQLIFRTFETAEAQYNALKAGDLDAVDDVPGKIFATIMAGDEPNITGIAGNQGSFSELAMNSSCPTGIGDGHVALKDPNVRRAINWSLDRQLMVDKVLNGFGKPAVGISASANPAFDYQVEADQTYSYDPAKANALLDEAGWIDTNGDGVRDKDGVELKLRYFDRSVGGGADTTPFITGFLKDVGIATEVKTFDEDSLAAIQSKSEFDLYTWGWSPYADPDNMLSNFTSSAVPTDPAVGGYNDGNWCNAEYDALYEQQKVELDPAKRADLIQQMHKIFVNDGPYAVLFKYDNLQAFRSDRWQNFERQPAEVGPIMFTQTSSAYLNLEPVSGDSGGGGGTNTIVVIGIALVAAGVVFTLVRSRRKKSADDRA
jgi:peptide/nickel transport system substrate-binding protein